MAELRERFDAVEAARENGVFKRLDTPEDVTPHFNFKWKELSQKSAFDGLRSQVSG